MFFDFACPHARNHFRSAILIVRGVEEVDFIDSIEAILDGEIEIAIRVGF